MTTTDTSAHDRILAERALYVSGGVSTPRLVVTRAEGARITDVDGRTFLDFAGGIGCQNTGHRFAPVVDAVKAQADAYLHQCFMVGVYEPYVETCRLLAELSPCSGEQQKSLLVNSGAEANENAVKIARSVTRTARSDRLRQRVPRADAADDDDDEQGQALQGRLRPVRSRGLQGAGALPLPRRRRATTRSQGSSGCSRARSTPRASRASCSSPCRARAASSRCPRTTPRACASSAARTGSSTSTTRCSRASAAPGRCGRSSTTTASSRTSSSPGKSIGGGLPLASVTGRAEIMDAIPAGRPRRHLRRQPALLRGRERRARGGARTGVPGARDGARRAAPRPPRGPQAATPFIGDVRGLGPMIAMEMADRSPDRAKAIVDARVRARTAAPRVRPLRQRAAAAACADDRRRRARGGSDDPRGVVRRRCVTAAPDILIRGLRKHYGEVAAVDGIDLEIAAR